jgi:pyrroloquinoline quinone (PQQ) biosynthesis protein C
MTFFQRLVSETQTHRQSLLSAPIIQAALNGTVTRESYLAFLQEAYHHVKHTVPLLHATREALPAHHQWLIEPLNEYIEEETGHEAWILDDIVACGGDRSQAQHSQPAAATELMVAYAYDTIARGNPLGFFGMVHVLEGTSVSLALMAADAIQSALSLPDAAFSYLRSHGTLDLEHTDHFESLMGHMDRADDQAAIVHAAQMFYRLYGDVFRGLPMPQATALVEQACH